MESAQEVEPPVDAATTPSAAELATAVRVLEAGAADAALWASRAYRGVRLAVQPLLARAGAQQFGGLGDAAAYTASQSRRKRAALERKESRGAQFRDDYPDKSAECATFNLVAKKAADGSMQVTRRPVVPMRADLKAVIEKMK